MKTDFSSPDWVAVIDRAKTCSRARARFVAAAQRYVASVVHHVWHGAQRDWDDAMQEANVGLLQAIDHFEASRGKPFTMYARFWICARLYLFELGKPVVTITKNSRIRAAAWAVWRGVEGDLGLAPDVAASLRAALGAPGSLGSGNLILADARFTETVDRAIDVRSALRDVPGGHLVEARLMGAGARAVAEGSGAPRSTAQSRHKRALAEVSRRVQA